MKPETHTLLGEATQLRAQGLSLQTLSPVSAIFLFEKSATASLLAVAEETGEPLRATTLAGMARELVDRGNLEDAHGGLRERMTRLGELRRRCHAEVAEPLTVVEAGEAAHAAELAQTRSRKRTADLAAASAALAAQAPDTPNP